MTVAQLVLDIRDTLSDPSGDRWTDARIIRSINSAQKDICLKGNILRGKHYLDLLANQSIYQLPADVLFITRAVNDSTVIALASHEELDVIDDTWESTTGDSVTHIVYDKNNMSLIKVYPVPESNMPANGIIATLGADSNFSSAFGVITAIQGPMDIYTGDGLVLYYTKKPTELTVVTDVLDLNDIWKTAIKHYVCGMLLRDDADTQNRAFGNEELQLYSIELAAALKASSSDFTKSNQYETNYRRF